MTNEKPPIITDEDINGYHARKIFQTTYKKMLLREMACKYDIELNEATIRCMETLINPMKLEELLLKRKLLDVYKKDLIRIRNAYFKDFISFAYTFGDEGYDLFIDLYFYGKEVSKVAKERNISEDYVQYMKEYFQIELDRIIVQ